MISGALVSLLAGALLAQDAQFVQDGPYWKRIENTTISAPPGRAIKVTTRGHVILRGSNGDRVMYRLTQQVRAHTEQEAHRVFGSSFSITRASVESGILTAMVIAPLTQESIITQLELNVPRRISVILDVRLGDVEAYDLDGNVHIDTTAGMIHCDRIRGAVEGNTGGGEIRLGHVGGSVRCSSLAGSILVDSVGGEANCQTAGGEIQIGEAGGPLVLGTEGGNIQVDKAASTVEAHSGAGVIDVFQAGGLVLADTRGGSIQVGSSRGARCQSGAGTIRVKTSSGPLRLQTAMGSILAELLAGARIEDASLIAGSGDITVLIPSNLAVSVLARNDSGANPHIFSDFSEVRAQKAGPARPAMVFEGAINGGGPLLSINTGGGIIYVKKMK